MTTLSDTSTWLPLDGLQRGFDANKAQLSSALAGRTVTVVDERGTRITHRFAANNVQWDYVPAAGESQNGTDEYEAFDVADGLIYAQFHHTDEPATAVSLMLDLSNGHALSIVTTIADPKPGHTRVRQEFVPSRIEGIEPTGPAPAPTTVLIGRRALWVYSEDHAYEHIYLSQHWYTWQCLAGPERGLADTDENTVYELRPGIYVFTWREKVIPCAAVTVADHRDQRNLRSHGALFGLDETGKTPTHFTFGAVGRLLSNTAHPAELDPAGS
ncbi:molybdenum cofactor biosynthesis protein MoaF [Nocardia panacis]|uniref:Molybdenum cofactor biosynthesis protein MoaF n=1 Tax=Nocardia panacis TaxID=2340916 RepID=A0A3A4KB29_9NOCA|nr:molybdenum cofactor biosynthesis F family protein [Nocardia panacis]RJO70801.1 molybdenum cofactor biosynthesis protein MoaF [Nocardia panacis]